MVAELKELFTAFGVAALALIAVALFIFRRGGKNDNASKNRNSPGFDKNDGQHHSDSDQQAEKFQEAAKQRAYDGPPALDKVFISSSAGENMQRVAKASVVAGRGIEGDRYFSNCGFWSEKDECEITLIAQEDLDDIERTTGINIQSGEHRRNLVTRNISLPDLIGKRFRIGEAQFAFERFRPPCLHIQQITEPGMLEALAHRSGICVHCFKSGVIQENDSIEILQVPSILDSVRAALRKHKEKGPP